MFVANRKRCQGLTNPVGSISNPLAIREISNPWSRLNNCDFQGGAQMKSASVFFWPNSR